MADSLSHSTGPSRVDATRIPLSSGIILQASLSEPVGGPSVSESALAVLLHPWSFLGGNMNDPTLRALVSPLISRRYHVLAFNSRGVGDSTGRPSFTGLREAKDLEDLVQWAIQAIPNIHSVVLIGYSHGSLIASLHPILPPSITLSYVLISYPLSPRGLLTLFHSATYAAALTALLRDARTNVLVVYGTRDEFTAERKYDTWAAELRAAANSDGVTGGKLEIVKVQDASHFWFGESAAQLGDVLRRWLP